MANLSPGIRLRDTNTFQDLYKLVWRSNYLVATAMEEVSPIRDGDSLIWLCKLKDTAFDLEDLLDDLKNRSRDGGGGIRRKVRDFFSSLKSSSSSWSVLFEEGETMARRIKDISHRIDEFSAVSSEGRGSASVSDTQYIEQNSPIESNVYGRDADKEEVIRLLLTDSDEHLSVLPIVGMGGIGKTTLAQIVYNDPRITAHFDLRLWVRVRRVFDVQDIGEALLEGITRERCRNPNTDFILQHLRAHLRSKRFLLVLDDVWNEVATTTEWEMLRDSLRSCRPGSKIVVTTRSLMGAKIMGTVAPYRLSPLSDDDCWEIFKLRAFGPRRNEVTIPSLVHMWKDLVARCGGLPLAAAVLGSHWRTKREEYEQSVNENHEFWRLPVGRLGILPTLMLSYDHMPTHLKKCFAYCSLFPKGYRLDRLKLIHLWIAQGYIQTLFDNRPLEEIGIEYFNYMLQNYFFQDEEKDDYGNIVSCKMHDLIHDLACFVAREESYTVRVGEEVCLPHRCFYLSVICDHRMSSGFLKDAASARKLRSLIMFGQTQIIFGQTQQLTREIGEFIVNATHLRALQFSGFPLKEFPNTNGKLRHLRFLDLSDTMIESVATSITNLHYLHFLDLSNTKVELLSESITTLYNLQTLRLRSCAKLQKLPFAIGKLENLRLLDLSHSGLLSLPKSIASLCSLQTLNLSNCSKLQKLPLTIGELHNLRLLDLSYSRVQSLPESIADLTDLQILNLKNCIEIRELPEGIQNMVNLNHLDIAGGQLFCMPCRLGRLIKLQTLPLFVVGNKPGHTIEELQHLNHIRGVLKITCLSNVKRPEEAKMANLAAKEVLHSLELQWRTGWTRKWGEVMIDMEAISQPSNENFDVDVFQNLQPHKNLRHLTVEDYRGSRFPTWLLELNEISSLPKLESFTLYNLEKCDHLPPLGQLPSLKHLKIESMYALKRIDTFGGTFLSLKYLKLWNLPSLKEWFALPEQEMFPSLETLIIVGCPELKIKPLLPSSLLEFEMESVNNEILVGGCLKGLSRLRKLRIAHFEASEAWWEGMQFLTSLENLEIMNCYWTCLPDRILQQHFPSLRTLKLTLNNDLKSLGEGGGKAPLFFSELRHLSIQGCDELTELPEWLCALNFLQSLELSYCDNLEMIPNKLRADLTQLTISGCPKLDMNDRGA